jgi:hypothetical protein
VVACLYANYSWYTHIKNDVSQTTQERNKIVDYE